MESRNWPQFVVHWRSLQIVRYTYINNKFVVGISKDNFDMMIWPREWKMKLGCFEVWKQFIQTTNSLAFGCLLILITVLTLLIVNVCCSRDALKLKNIETDGSRLVEAALKKRTGKSHMVRNSNQSSKMEYA